MLLRFLTKQPLDQAEQARDIFERGQRLKFNLVIEPLILAEVIYVLLAVYDYNHERVRNELLALLSTGVVRFETVGLERVAIEALSKLSPRLDSLDTYLAALVRLSGGQVVSFDKGLGTLEVDWLNPGDNDERNSRTRS